eukprot:3024271-Alexandrium_andersonii.AAC.1
MGSRALCRAARYHCAAAQPEPRGGPFGGRGLPPKVFGTVSTGLAAMCMSCLCARPSSLRPRRQLTARASSGGSEFGQR